MSAESSLAHPTGQKTLILPLDVVHNHFAKVEIPRGLFGSEVEEWITEPDGKGGIDVKKVEARTTPVSSETAGVTAK